MSHVRFRKEKRHGKEGERGQRRQGFRERESPRERGKPSDGDAIGRTFDGIRRTWDAIGDDAHEPASLAARRDDGVFDRFFGRWPATRQPIQPSERFWDMGVEEKDDEILVRAEAPGFDPKDFDIHVGRNALTIQAEHKEESGKDEGNVQRWEQHSFFRSIPLSTPVSADKVEAKYRNGILEVHLPRTEMSPQKRIEVES